jgi:hypothetical protein
MFSTFLFAQNFTGQWKGVFSDRSVSFTGFGGSECDYVLDLECKGKTVSGYSYTYFNDDGKRYYTICKLKGFLDKKTKYIEVREVERTKSNVPNNIKNCFQIHKLTYSKEEGTETLQGNWIPAPDQQGDCGYGITTLTRRNLRSVFPAFKNATAKKTTKKTTPKPNNVVKKATPKKPAPAIVKKAPIKPVKKDVVLSPNKDSFTKHETDEKTIPQTMVVPSFNFEKRNNTLLKTIQVENETIKVDLYDNGEVDGDSISLFYNGKLLLSHKRLSEKAITLTVSVPQDNSMNELVMYAENLGTIPPNTALMIVTDGTKRYEVRITSDLQKSGTIRFVHKTN